MFAIAFPLLFLYPIAQKSRAEALQKLQEKRFLQKNQEMIN